MRDGNDNNMMLGEQLKDCLDQVSFSEKNKQLFPQSKISFWPNSTCTSI